MIEETLYDILEVSPKASSDVINKAHKTLALKYHPDRNPGDSESAEIMKKINEAYSILSDPEKRKQYDEKLLWSSSQQKQWSSWNWVYSQDLNKTQTSSQLYSVRYNNGIIYVLDKLTSQIVWQYILSVDISKNQDICKMIESSIQWKSLLDVWEIISLYSQKLQELHDQYYIYITYKRKDINKPKKWYKWIITDNNNNELYEFTDPKGFKVWKYRRGELDYIKSLKLKDTSQLTTILWGIDKYIHYRDKWEQTRSKILGWIILTTLVILWMMSFIYSKWQFQIKMVWLFIVPVIMYLLSYKRLKPYVSLEECIKKGWI